MFSLFPSAFRPYHKSHCADSHYTYRDYIRAQRARQLEAQYHARLEGARAYPEKLARQEPFPHHSDFFSAGSDEESYSSSIPGLYSHHHQDCPPSARRGRSLEDLAQQHHDMKESDSREEDHINIPQPCISISITEPQEDNQKSLSIPSHDVRDIAARKIQACIRSFLPRLRALRVIASISQQLSETQEKFQFPLTLDFNLTSLEGVTPPMLFTPRNAPVHGHEHALEKLLSDLDVVESRGDARVRAARKQLVKRLESALAGLDERKEMIWREMVNKSSGHANTPGSGHFSQSSEGPTPSQEPDDHSAMDLDTSLLYSREEEDEVEQEISLVPDEEIVGGHENDTSEKGGTTMLSDGEEEKDIQ